MDRAALHFVAWDGSVIAGGLRVIDLRSESVPRALIEDLQFDRLCMGHDPATRKMVYLSRLFCSHKEAAIQVISSLAIAVERFAFSEGYDEMLLLSSADMMPLYNKYGFKSMSKKLGVNLVAEP